MVDKEASLKKLLRQSHHAQNEVLSWISGLGMGFGVFMVPGLFIGVLITQSSMLFWVFIFFCLALGLRMFLQWFLNKTERKRFLKLAVESGVSKTEAEIFIKKVNWGEVFPEYN